MTTPEKKTPLSIAVIKFHADGAVEVTLSSCNGVNGRRIDAVSVALYKKLGELRAIERRKDSANRRAQATLETDEENPNAR